MFTVPDSLTQFLRSEHALLIAVSCGWLVICFTWWRASRRRAAALRRVAVVTLVDGMITEAKVARPPEDVVFVEEPGRHYKSFEQFREDLVNDKVPIAEVFERCGGSIPAKRAAAPPPPVPPPVPRLDVGDFSVAAYPSIPGQWAVWDRRRGFGEALVMSTHLTYEEALKRAKYLNYER